MNIISVSIKRKFKIIYYNIMSEDKLASLEEAISYPPYNEIKGLTTIDVDSFDYDTIREKIHSSDSMGNIEGEKLNLIDEMIKLLASNKKKFNIDTHNYIVLYWRGLPMLVIKTKGSNTQTMMYIAVKTYKDELSKKTMTKFGSKIVFGAGVALVATSLLYFYKSFNSSD